MNKTINSFIIIVSLLGSTVAPVIPALNLAPPGNSETAARNIIPINRNAPVKKYFRKNPDFFEIDIDLRSLANRMSSIPRKALALFKIAVLMNGYNLKGPLYSRVEYHNIFSDDWENFYFMLSYVIQNLAQHEYYMTDGMEPKKLVLRIYRSNSPYDGIRIDFWGEGKYPLPDILTSEEWFTINNLPWKRKAPRSLRSLGTESGQGIRAIFNKIKIIEQGSLIPKGEHISIGWRNDTNNEGPYPGGHIISIHLPLEKLSSENAIETPHIMHNRAIMHSL